MTPWQREVEPPPSCSRCTQAITRLDDLYRCAQCHAAFHLACIREHFGWSVNENPHASDVEPPEVRVAVVRDVPQREPGGLSPRQGAVTALGGPVHYPHCNDRCVHYLAGPLASDVEPSPDLMSRCRAARNITAAEVLLGEVYEFWQGRPECVQRCGWKATKRTSAGMTAEARAHTSTTGHETAVIVHASKHYQRRETSGEPR